MSDSNGSAPRIGTLASTFRALNHYNYRLFFGGQGTSLIGTWMTRVATSLLVYEITGKDWILGIVSFAGQIPILIVAPVAGVWVEGRSRYRILVATQALSMIQSFALAWLSLAGIIQVWQIIALAAVQGIINAVDTPARQAFLVEIVEDRRDLSNAIALNSSMFNAARLIGPSIAGLLYAQVGAGICFLIDGVSYLAVIAALLAMRVKPHVAKIRTHNIWHDLVEGFVYVYRQTPLRAIFLLLGLVSIFGVPYATLMPVFANSLADGQGVGHGMRADESPPANAVSDTAVPEAKTQLSKNGARIYGFLLAASGTGALCGALFLASRSTILGLGRVIAFNATMFALSAIVFALSRTIWLSLATSFTAGFGMMAHMAASNTIVQTVVDDDKRSRVMGFYTMTVLGLTPVGSLFAAGSVVLLNARYGTPFGAQYTVAIGGGLSLLGALYFILRLPSIRKSARPMLEKAGVLPPIAAGIESATQAERLGTGG
ncbi:MAG TPA: MFS transporter [Pirellulales bacterium]|jgi:MFS family permease|nr:MFS transporter [Pirellulales bacterium]